MARFLDKIFRKRQKFQSPPAGYLNPHSTLGELDMYLSPNAGMKIYGVFLAHMFDAMRMAN